MHRKPLAPKRSALFMRRVSFIPRHRPAIAAAETEGNKIVADNKPPASGRGRPKGALNKTTLVAKEAIALAADKLGGTERLVDWAKEDSKNEAAFWTTIYPKLLPLQVNGPGEDGEHIHKVVRKIVRPSHTNG